MKIAYIISRFPHLPETFILRELVEIDRRGWQISLYPLIYQKLTVIHEEAREWISRAHYTPYISLNILKQNWKIFRKNPLKYIKVFGHIIKENLSSVNFLSRAVILFPKAVYMAQKLSEDKIDHIHAHYATHPSFVAWVIHQFTGISYSITTHAHDIYICHAMLETKLRDSAFVVAISLYNINYLADLVGDWVRTKTHLIHCGIDPIRYHRRRVNLSGSENIFNVINVGSLQPYKGQIYLVQAGILLRKRGIPFHIKIVGGGEEFKRLFKMVKKAHIEDMIELTGSKTQAEVAEVLSLSDCYVQPSIIMPDRKMEGLPVALMEALACELPVVATHISGVPELIRDGETGYLIPPADADSLANSLERIYRNPDTAISMAKFGHSLILEEFDIKRNVNQLLILFGNQVDPLYCPENRPIN